MSKTDRELSFPAWLCNHNLDFPDVFSPYIPKFSAYYCTILPQIHVLLEPIAEKVITLLPVSLVCS